nr:hypothetical protein Iba_chr13aCG10720 [Ipomoea batatas]
MLVTYKSKQTTASKQPHPPKKNVNARTKRGNQYDALNSVQEDGEPLSTRNKSDKGKAKPGPNQGSKDKSSAPINPALINPSQVRASPPHPVSQTVQPGVPSTQIPAHRDTATWVGQTGLQNIFQFGGPHALLNKETATEEKGYRGHHLQHSHRFSAPNEIVPRLP